MAVKTHRRKADELYWVEVAIADRHGRRATAFTSAWPMTLAAAERAAADERGRPHVRSARVVAAEGRAAPVRVEYRPAPGESALLAGAAKAAGVTVPALLSAWLAKAVEANMPDALRDAGDARE